MYRVAIVDDDLRQADGLAAMLRMSRYADDLAVSRYGSPDLAAPDLARGRIDILFMDIRFDGSTDEGPEHLDGSTGIDAVLSHMPSNSVCQVIYVSGYLEYVSDVYRTGHIGFLPKPVDAVALDEALGRAVGNLNRLRANPLLVRVDGALVRVPPQSIFYVESRRRKVEIHERARVLVTYARLADLEQRLPSRFARCHKSFLVNMDRIAELRATELLLTNGEVVPVSQRCRRELRERFAAHLADVR